MTRGAVLIVKNEAATIERCLASARAAGVTVFTVVDTGSTDETLDVLRSAPDVRLWRRDWRDFGHNRSEAFSLARGTATWLLALDADMTCEWDEGWEPDLHVDAYLLAMHDSGDSWRLPLLLRGDLPWVSRGAVHEYTLLADGTIGRRAPTDAIRITNHGENRSSPGKSLWHAQMLEAELAREPNNPRTVFYLAQTYRQLGDPRALELYRRRAFMGGWDEEAWYAGYRAALLQEWPAKADALIRAWEARPQRLEPLYDLLRELNSRDLHHAAYRLASGVSGPCGDELFMRPWVWDWGIAYERSIAAWHVGHHDEFLRLSFDLLENERLPDPERAAVIRNLGLRAA